MLESRAAEVRTALHAVRRRCVHPPLVTTAAIVAVAATAVHYGVFHHELALDVAFRYGFSGRAIGMQHWSTLATSQFLSRDPFMAVSISLSLALMLGLYEMVAGSWRAVVVTAITAVAGPLLVAAALGVGNVLGSAFAARTLSTLDYGASAVTAGAGGALVAVLGMRRLRWFAIFWVVVGLAAHHQLADWEHLAAFTSGYGLGRMLGAPPLRTVGAARIPSRRLALVVPSLALAAAIGLAVPGWAVPPRPSTPLATGHLTIGRHTLAMLRRGRPSVSVSSSPAQVVSIRYPTPSLGGTRQAYVVLPPGYQGSHRRYPVVEILHGRPGSANDVIAGLDPVGTESLPGVPSYIAVVPDGHGPVVSDGDFADTTRQRLGAAVSDDLLRFIDRHYRTIGPWSVSGLSSGGYGAAYLASRTPRQYGAVCALSGNFVPDGPAFRGQPMAVLRADAPLLHARADGPRVLIVAGAADRGSVIQARSYDAALTRAGEVHQLDIVPGGHTWAVWSSAFPTCLRFMLVAPVPGTASAPAMLAAMPRRSQ